MTYTLRRMYPSGTYIDFLRPEAATIRIDDLAWSLSMQCRFGGSCARFYSVAEHSIYVSDLLAGDDLAYEGLMHDAHEGITQDLITGMKVACPQIKELELRWAVRVRELFQLPLKMPEKVNRADLIALATERRDLGLDDSRKWPTLENISPLPAKLWFISQSRAYEKFLNAYTRLRLSRERPA